MSYNCRAASDGRSQFQEKPLHSGAVAEASQLQNMHRRLSAAEREAEGARAELLRACQQLQAAAADTGRCRGLEHSLQVHIRPHNPQGADSPPDGEESHLTRDSSSWAVLQHIVCSTDALAKYKRARG
jgi:hypothetical protein